MAKPNLVSVVEQKPRTLADTIYEERRGMNAHQLIELMGEKWIGHPKYKPQGKVPPSAIPLRNLVDRITVDAEAAPRTFWSFLAWVFS